jgi:hypothetical protein
LPSSFSSASSGPPCSLSSSSMCNEGDAGAGSRRRKDSQKVQLFRPGARAEVV